MSTSSYQMWIMKDQGSAKIPVLILPETYEYSLGGSAGERVDIIGLGEVVQRKDRDCIRVSFSSRIPQAGDPAIERYVPDMYRTMRPAMYRFALDAFLRKGKDPIQLVIVGTPVNIYCWVDDWTIREYGGTGKVGVYEYDLSVVEYREPGVVQVEVDPQTNTAVLPVQEEPRPDTRIAPSTYTVKPGDTIASIAKELYGSESQMNSIFENNRESLTNPMLLPPGTVLKMPL